MTSDVLFFISVAAGILGQGLDDITTNAGLSTGGVEQNAVVAWAIKKLGFPAVSMIKVGGLAIGLPSLFYGLNHHTTGIIIALFASAAGFAAGIINYIRLKKAKISVF